MNKAILGKKIGMTQIFLADGRLVPVTVVEAGPCVVTQIKTKEYYLGMKGKTYLYGVCFQNKKAKVLFEEMDL